MPRPGDVKAMPYAPAASPPTGCRWVSNSSSAVMTANSEERPIRRTPMAAVSSSPGTGRGSTATAWASRPGGSTAWACRWESSSGSTTPLTGTRAIQRSPRTGMVFVVVWVDQTGPSVYEHALRRFDADGDAGRCRAALRRHGYPADRACCGRESHRSAARWHGRARPTAFPASSWTRTACRWVSSSRSTAASRYRQCRPRPLRGRRPGQYVVAWGHGCRRRWKGRFSLGFLDPLGMPVGIEFQVNTTTAGEQVQAAVATDSTGEVVIAWQSDDADGRGIAARRFSASGMPVGVELRLNRSQEGRAVSAERDLHPRRHVLRHLGE
jgi:hypothetical protein